MKRKLCLLFFVYFLLSLAAMNNVMAVKQEKSTISLSKNAKNLAVSSPTVESGRVKRNNSPTIKENKLKEVTDPLPLEIKSRFLEGYKAEIKIKPTGKSYVFDLRKNKKKYDELGLFFNNKPNEPTELMVQSFSTLDPVMMYGGVRGLRGVQKISGVDINDIIATVESYWIYSGGGWELQRVNVNEKIAY
ncbi:MAG: hypothetical protein Q8906_05635 [Bacillota bacterium]|nr:hypothetical protein [Bacillota bacterium]